MSKDRERPELPKDPEEEWKDNYRAAWNGIFDSYFNYLTEREAINRGIHYPFTLISSNEQVGELNLELTLGFNQTFIREERPVKVETLQLRVYKESTKAEDSGDAIVNWSLVASLNGMREYQFDPFTNAPLTPELYAVQPDIYTQVLTLTRPDLLGLMHGTIRQLDNATKHTKERKIKEAASMTSEENEVVEKVDNTGGNSKLDETHHATTKTIDPHYANEENKENDSDQLVSSGVIFDFIVRLGVELGYDRPPNS